MNYNGKILADVHFGRGDSEHLSYELEEVFMKKIVNDGDKTDFVIINGDLYHRILRLNEPASKYSFNFILNLVNYAKKYDFKIRIIKGTKTHDFNQLQTFKTLEKENPELIRVIESVEEEMLFPDFPVLYVPEEYMENPDEYYKSYINQEKKYKLTFVHGNFDFVDFSKHITDDDVECEIKNSPIFKYKDFKDLATATICGHVHERTKKGNVYYVGSYSRLSYGQEKPKGYIEVNYNNENDICDVNYIDNHLAPEFVTVYFDELEGSLEDKLDTIKKLKEEVDNLRIKNRNNEETDEEEIKMIKKIVSNSENIKIQINKPIKVKDVDEKYRFVLDNMNDITKIKKFIEVKNGKEVPKNIIEDFISKE